MSTRLFRYGILLVFNMALTAGIVELFDRYLDLYLVGKIVSTALTTLWNFPIMNVVRKIAPALAAGCSIIIKPSEETAGSAVEVLKCFQDAGLPGDVAQCVFGVPDMVSRHLLASPITRKLSFTGSVPVGKALMKLAADTMMRTTM